MTVRQGKKLKRKRRDKGPPLFKNPSRKSHLTQLFISHLPKLGPWPQAVKEAWESVLTNHSAQVSIIKEEEVINIGRVLLTVCK